MSAFLQKAGRIWSQSGRWLLPLLGWATCIGIGTRAAQAEEEPSFSYIPDAYLKSTAPQDYGYFGHSVAICGNIAVVGEYYSGSGQLIQEGSVHVFERASSSAPWTFAARLQPVNRYEFNQFGWSVDVSGETIVVGARYEGSTRDRIRTLRTRLFKSGAAYVFTRDEEGFWNQEAHLKASNAAPGDLFGWSVAVSGERVVVGAPEEGARGEFGDPEDDKVERSGAAYVFELEDGRWVQQGYLKSPSLGVLDYFGNAVDVDGDTIVIGSPGKNRDVEGKPGRDDQNVGAAYVFELSKKDEWIMRADLSAPDAKYLENFGHAVAISGQTAVVSATGDDGVMRDSGAAYVFARGEDEAWHQEAYLKASDAQTDDDFGRSVDISGDDIIIGAPGDDWIFPPPQLTVQPGYFGAAYTYTRMEAGGWQEVGYLISTNADSGDTLGQSVAISGDSLLVGAIGEDSSSTGIDGDQLNNDITHAGAAYSFERSPDQVNDIAIHRGPNGTWKVVVPLVRGRQVGIEFSPDLSPGSWVELGNFTPSEGNNQFTDPDLNRQTGRGFYRAFYRELDP